MTDTATPRRPRGRPPTGDRVEVRLDPTVVAVYDRHAGSGDYPTRSALLRLILEAAAEELEIASGSPPDPPEPPAHLSSEAAYGWTCGWAAAASGRAP